MELRKNYKINFYVDFIEKNRLLDCYKSIEFKNNPKILYKLNKASNIETIHHNYQIILIPDYFKLTPNPTLKIIQIPQNNKGYSIHLENYQDADSFLRLNLKRDSKKILARLKRLHLCFKIKSKTYNTQILKNEYDFLMTHFKKMLERRFKQRNNLNMHLQNWNLLYESTFQLLKEKKASLFVIYDKSKPIHISLLYHMQKILVSGIPAYDIDYEKFGLGNIAVYKKIEWCFNNGINIIDMGYGDLEYKKRWSNKTYSFNTHILYDKRKIHLKLLAYLQFMKYSLKEYIKKKEIINLIRKYQSILTFKTKPQKTNFISDYRLEELREIPIKKDEKPINIEHKEYFFLRKPVYDFQYLNFTSSENISVYKSNMAKGAYIITNNKKNLRVTF